MTTDRTGGPRQGPLASQGCVPFMARALLIALLLANGCGISNGRPSDVPSSARLPNTSPTETAGDSSGDDDAAECLVLRDSSPASTSGQINFRTKTRNGLRGLLPKPFRLHLWRKKSEEEGLDTTKRVLHMTSDALVLEIEGEDECLSIARGPESAPGARVTVVRRKDAGIADGSPGHRLSLPVDGLFGVYDLPSGPFVAIIHKSKLRYVNRELGVEFRLVSKVRLVPVPTESRALDDAEAREEARLLALLALAFRSHQFYFSHAHDVTQTLQSLRIGASSSTMDQTNAEKNGDSKTPTSNKNKADPLDKKRGGHKRKRSREAPGKAKRRIRSEGVAQSSAQGRKSRRTGAVSTTAHASALSPQPSPDERFFWNLGVLGALVDLRERLENGEVDHGQEGLAGGPRGVVAAGTGEASREGDLAAVDRWLTPIMSGFLQVERGCRVGDKEFDVLFVSRRSRLRQGTRFTRRGIDDGGNVANFVETEQALLHQDRSVTSHVQIRGSIPVLWSSPTNLRYHPKVRIDPNQKASLRALRRHAEDLIRLYGKKGGGIVFVNLVDKKKEQGELGEKFDASLKAVAEGAGREGIPDDDQGSQSEDESQSASKGVSPSDGSSRGDGIKGSDAVDLSGSLRHVWFDFHHECRNMHWENLDKLLAIVDHEFGEQGFYHSGPNGETLSLQNGVIRTNCMDCLDRTNVVQSLLARRSMLVQLQAVGIDVPEPETGNSTALALTLDMLEMPAEELERRFRDLWGNNADEISILYAGTPALKGDFTRTGQRTKLGLLQDGTNSAIRYVVNNFQDHRRQEAVDVLLGVHRPTVDVEGNVVNESFKGPLDLDTWTTRLAPPFPPTPSPDGGRDTAGRGGERMLGPSGSSVSPSSVSSLFAFPFARSSMTGPDTPSASTSSDVVSNPDSDSNSDSDLTLSELSPSSFKGSTAGDVAVDAESTGGDGHGIGVGAGATHVTPASTVHGGRHDGESHSSSSSSSSGSDDGEESSATVRLRHALDRVRDTLPQVDASNRENQEKSAQMQAKTPWGIKTGAGTKDASAAAGAVLSKVSTAAMAATRTGEREQVGAVVERVAGAALAELRMAGPYSVLTLSALLVMAVGGSDTFAFSGVSGGARLTTWVLLAGLFSLPLMSSVLEFR